MLTNHSIVLGLILLASCSRDTKKDILLISETILNEADYPSVIREVDPDCYCDVVSMYVVKNNSGCDILIHNFMSNVINPISVRFKYQGSDSVFDETLRIGSLSSEQKLNFKFLLNKDKVDTLYACRYWKSNVENMWLEIEYIKKGKVHSQYLK